MRTTAHPAGDNAVFIFVVRDLFIERIVECAAELHTLRSWCVVYKVGGFAARQAIGYNARPVGDGGSERSIHDDYA